MICVKRVENVKKKRVSFLLAADRVEDVCICIDSFVKLLYEYRYEYEYETNTSNGYLFRVKKRLNS